MKLDLADRSRRNLFRKQRPHASCISPRRPAYATRWRIRTRTCEATWSDSSTFSRVPSRPDGAPRVREQLERLRRESQVAVLASTINVDHPISLYAATKKSNELMAHTYSHLFSLPTTGLRFFTVYGPWGRPDMSYFEFTRAILDGLADRDLQSWRHARDFTYVDDIVEGVVRVLDPHPRAVVRSIPPTPMPDPRRAQHRSGSTTSATASRSSCSSTSAWWRRRPGGKRRSISNPCNPGTSWRRPRTRGRWRLRSGSGRGRGSTRGSDGMSSGIGGITARLSLAPGHRFAGVVPASSENRRRSGDSPDLGEHEGCAPLSREN